MYKFKKILILILVLLSAALVLISCNEESDDGKISIVCSDFSEYDWTRNILGDNADMFRLTYLLDDGSDPHSFQPSISDIAEISRCDLFIYLGGGSDTWTKDALNNAVNKEMKTLCIYDLFKDSLLPMSNSSCHEEENEHEHRHTGEDEHLWLSLVNAKTVVNTICELITQLHPEGAEVYSENCKKYVAALEALDTKYREAVDASQGKVLVFADRFPFTYLARDYSLEYFSAYIGCSADSELSEDRIVYLADIVDEHSIGYICVTESADLRLANTVIAETEKKDAEILSFNSCQSVTSKQVSEGFTYIDVMESNLEALIKALG